MPQCLRMRLHTPRNPHESDDDTDNDNDEATDEQTTPPRQLRHGGAMPSRNSDSGPSERLVTYKLKSYTGTIYPLNRCKHRLPLLPQKT